MPNYLIVQFPISINTPKYTLVLDNMDPNHPLLDMWKQKFKLGPSEVAAFEAVNRSDFVDSKLQEHAYDDRPLPILRGKTISQPTTVMFMTRALQVERGNKVFEVGTGSGYQTAILSHLVGEGGKVYSAEVLPELVAFARKNVEKAGCDNITIIEEDGSKGYPEAAPFDRIIITAACKQFPQPLLDQLKPNGIIVGPMGSAQEQEMVRGTKDAKGRLSMDFLGQFLFSPLTGQYGFEE